MEEPGVEPKIGHKRVLWKEAMILPDIPATISLEQQDAVQTSSQVHPHQLRAKRVPRYRCRTCGSRNCSCVNLVVEKKLDKRLARGGPTPTSMVRDAPSSTQNHTITSQKFNLVIIVITVEKTYSSIASGTVPTLETT